MRPISPNTGAPETDIAEGQHEYLQMVVAEYYDTERNSPVRFSRWTLTDKERLAVANGEDIFVGLMTFGQPLQPLQVQVGPQHLTVKDYEEG